MGGVGVEDGAVVISCSVIPRSRAPPLVSTVMPRWRFCSAFGFMIEPAFHDIYHAFFFFFLHAMPRRDFAMLASGALCGR